MGPLRNAKVAAGAKIYRGSMVALSATGFAAMPTAATGLKIVGVATQTVDNTAGADGDKSIDYKVGVFCRTNSASADLITIADIGNLVYAIDGGTVAKVATGRSAAGTCVGIDAVLGPMVAIGAPVSW